MIDPGGYRCADPTVLLFVLRKDYETAARSGYRAMWELYSYYVRQRDKLAMLQEKDVSRRADWGMYKKCGYMSQIIEEWLRN